MELTEENVHEIFIECLYKENENTEEHVKTEAIMMTIGFHPKRLKINSEKIVHLLNQLPNTFQKDGGGGMSFLNMCDDKNNKQWTNSHKQMDELVALGIASGNLNYILPRELWSSLPGNMPYLVVDSI